MRKDPGFIRSTLTRRHTRRKRLRPRSRRPAEVRAEEGGRFCIDGERAADWLLGEFAGIDAEVERVQATAVRRVQELQADLARLESLFGAAR